MRKHTSTLFLCFALLSAMVYFSCRKTIELDNNDKAYPIELRLTQEGDSVVLEWDQKSTTNFTKTIVLRSSEPIPDGVVPQSGAQRLVVLNTTDNSVNKAKLGLPVFEEKAFFKVYVQLGTRFVESNAVSANFNRFVGQGRPENTFFHPDSSWMVMAVLNSQNATTYTALNYRTQKKMGEYSLGFVSDFNLLSCTFTRVQGKEYMLATNNSTYYKFEMPSMSLVETGNANYSLWDILAAPNCPLIFTTQYDYIQGATARKWTGFETPLRTYERPNDYYYPRKLAFLNPSALKFVEVGPYYISRFQASATTGNLVPSYSLSINGDGQYPFIGEIPQSPNLGYFIPNARGNIYDSTLTLVKTLPLDPQTVVFDFSFSNDGKFVYSLEQFFDVNGSGSRIRKIELSTLQSVAKIDFFELQPKRIRVLPTGEVLFLFADIQTQSKYSLQIINL